MKLRRYELIIYAAALLLLTASAIIAVRHDTITDNRRLREENEALQNQIEIYREQLRILDTRLAELEALLNLTSALDGTGLAGLAPALMTAGKVTGTDPVLLAAICAHESGWGTSGLAVTKNNLAGLGAYRAGLGMTFDTRAECVEYLAGLLAGRPGSLAEVGAWYAEDPGWAAKVAGCMKIITEAGQ